MTIFAMMMTIVLLAPSIPRTASAQGSAPVCTTPEIVPLSAIVISPDATPVAQPDASPVASPVAIEDLVTGDSPGVQGQIERALLSIAVCQAERRVKTLTKYVTENFLSEVYAGGGKMTKEQFIVLGRDLPRIPVTIRSVNDVTVASNGDATADVLWTVGNQLFHAEWRFVFTTQDEGDDTGDDAMAGFWLADGVSVLPVVVPEGSNKTSVSIKKNAYDPAEIRVKGPDFVLNISNEDRVDHELLVVALAEGLTTADLLSDAGASVPAGITVLGQITIPAREKGKLVLVGMVQGQYAVVDLLPDENGAPHLAGGMQAVLTVR